MRASGVLMPVSSLPSRYGIGCFSKEAYEFVDCLERAGQSKWQVLPLGPTGYGDSPYQPFSTFAGNPYFIDLDMLVEEGLLFKEECEQLQWGGDPRFVDYERIYFSKNEILRKAYGRFDADDKFYAFCKKSRNGWNRTVCSVLSRTARTVHCGQPGRKNCEKVIPKKCRIRKKSWKKRWNTTSFWNMSLTVSGTN